MPSEVVSNVVGKQSNPIKVSVTNLAVFSCRQGDLWQMGPAGPTAQQGIRAHQRLQSTLQMDSEVRVISNTTLDDTKVRLSGRMDLLDRQAHTIGEIKTTRVPQTQLPIEQTELHWAQLMLYGYCYLQELRSTAAEESDLLTKLPNTVTLQIYYTNLLDEQHSVDTRKLSCENIEAYAHQALRQYIQWIKLVRQWQHKTSESAKALVFPHAEFRQGQRDMAAATYRLARDGGAVICEAPTGIGKTISALFPAIKALGSDAVKHVSYLTAKTSGRETALGALGLLKKSGLETTSVVLRSKKLTCFCSNGRCERGEDGRCEMTIGFFDRLPEARLAAMHAGMLDGETVDEIAWKHQICPFEFALQLLPWVSLVVCDYNYVFDPLVKLGWYAESRKNTMLLIDEAHNLLDRSRTMYSAKLRRGELLFAAKQNPSLAKPIKRLAKLLLNFSSEHNDTVSLRERLPENIRSTSATLVDDIVNAFADGQAHSDTLVELFKSLCRLGAIAELYSDQHKTLVTVDKKGALTDVEIHLWCTDASNFLQPCFNNFKANLLFSATLRPPVYYRDSLGLGEATQSLMLESPFDPERCLQLQVPFIDTRYKSRESSATSLCELIKSVSAAQAGNYLVFFPSYAYLSVIYELFGKLYPDEPVWRQHSDELFSDRQSQLQKMATSTLGIGFAILGGSYGEGVDYPGSKLIGAIVVSVGLPGNGKEQELIANGCKEAGLDGYDYAYRYPGFTRVQQTVGRVIRTESDRGVVVLVDDRFSHRVYQDLYPRHWKIQRAANIAEIESKLKQFW
ncbi:MAG: ATP-dependent DNA helicase [Granulosicoccaceae bacterium]